MYHPPRKNDAVSAEQRKQMMNKNMIIFSVSRMEYKKFKEMEDELDYTDVKKENRKSMKSVRNNRVSRMFVK